MSVVDALRLPVVSLAAEYLTIGNLLRRNVLAYKAPPNQEGYDILCINPDPMKKSRALRVQVKSRYQSDSNRTFMVRQEKLSGADYVVLVFLNIGYFYRRRPAREGARAPEFYTLPIQVARRLYSRRGRWQLLDPKGVNLERYRDERGFDQIARALHVPYPAKNAARRSKGKEWRAAQQSVAAGEPQEKPANTSDLG
jgi:hypothetical protein